MGFLKNLFRRNGEPEHIEPVNLPEEDEFKWECKGCGDGINPDSHRYTKRNGFYFHKVCWKKALKIAKMQKVI